MICLPPQTPRTADFYLVSHSLGPACHLHSCSAVLVIGILAASLQARHVRPSLARLGEIRMASYGCFTAVFAFACLTLLPFVRGSYALSTTLLYAAATGLAYTSATVVTSLTAAAASCCDAEGGRPELQRGRALGVVRSKACRAVGVVDLR